MSSTCLVGIPVYLDLILKLSIIDCNIIPGSSCLSCLPDSNPSLSSFNSKLLLSLTEISVQGATVSLACWVGFLFYLILILIAS